MPINIISLQWPFLSVTVNVWFSWSRSILFYSHLGWILALNAIKSVFLFLIWSGLICLCVKVLWSDISCRNYCALLVFCSGGLYSYSIRETTAARIYRSLGSHKAAIPTSFSSFTAKVFIQSNDVINGFFYVFNRKENRCDMAARSSTNYWISGLFRCAYEVHGHWSYISRCQ